VPPLVQTRLLAYLFRAGALRRCCYRITFAPNISHKRFGAMNERLSIPLPSELADWLRREAERIDRPVAWLARRLIEAGRRNEAQADRRAA
jgi:hypothetical protein